MNVDIHTALAGNADALSRSLAAIMADGVEEPDSGVCNAIDTAVALLVRGATRDPVESVGVVASWIRIASRLHSGKLISIPLTAESSWAIRAAWTELLAPSLDAAGNSKFESLLDSMLAQLTARPGIGLRTLFVGDCLVWDIALQLQILAEAHGIQIEPTVRAQRVTFDLRRTLEEMVPGDFDVIFYSPFTFEFSAEYAFLTSPRNILRSFGRFDLLQEAMSDVAGTIDLLSTRFDCPVFVHTVSGVRQLADGFPAMFANWLSFPARHYAKRILNRQLDDVIGRCNLNSKARVLRVDEASLLANNSASELGRIAFNAGELHPTLLAADLASGPYLDAVRVASTLLTKKVVVCDLDNTLWDGVIGDGPVAHHLDRQQVLRQLKGRGVLLAISSKNDPLNVSWGGGCLNAEDFVASEINWSAKAHNVKKLCATLNIKSESFVFLDDRPDERAMVAESLPGILVMDPNEPETWRLLALWNEMCRDSEVGDRTSMYHDRAKRQACLDEGVCDEDGIAAAYRRLGLKVVIRRPRDAEMARVVELINRTNQFNTTGARTTPTEMQKGVRGGTHEVAVAEVRDKFGDMGIAGVIVIRRPECSVCPEVSTFVLSCRVFGFGIEMAMLDAVVRRVPDGLLVAAVVETTSNKPCRDVFERFGFLAEDGQWIHRGVPQKTLPGWLEIESCLDE